MLRNLVTRVREPEEEGERRAIPAPRGNAKSTFVKAACIWVPCHDREITSANGGRPIDCILLLSYAVGLPISFINDIRRELTSNEYIREYYPEVVGQGVKWTEQQTQTKNGTWICAGATRKEVRGIMPENKRPKLIFFDDFESMENAKTMEQRKKTRDWVFFDVLRTSDPKDPADAVAVGTIVHRDSVLSQLKDEWSGQPFRAVIRDAKNEALWEEWEELYLDMQGELGDARTCAKELWEVTGERLLEALDGGEDTIAADEHLHEWWGRAFVGVTGGTPRMERNLRESYKAGLMFCEDYRDELPGGFQDIAYDWESGQLESIREVVGRHSNARKFFENHREAMLEGSRVLWPEVQPYYRLRCIRAENPIAFFQEMQNEVRRGEEELFGMDAWQFFKAMRSPTPTKMRELFPRGTIFIGGVDPSMGKRSKKHDPSGVIILGKRPPIELSGKRVQNFPWRIAWAEVNRIKPSEIFARMVLLHEIFNCKSWAVEAVQFQELFADLMIEASSIPIHKVRHQEQKEIRIKGIEPHVANGKLEYPSRTDPDDPDRLPIPIFRQLWEQFEWFGENDVHDDGPDATEMAWTEAHRFTRDIPIMPETEYIEREREPTDYERVFAEHEPAECPHCWQKLPEGANICRHCEREIPGGAKIHVEPEDPAEAEEQKRQREKAKRMDMIQKALAMKN